MAKHCTPYEKNHYTNKYNVRFWNSLQRNNKYSVKFNYD